MVKMYKATELFEMADDAVENIDREMIKKEQASIRVPNSMKNVRDYLAKIRANALRMVYRATLILQLVWMLTTNLC
jgi:hypothetical protein